MLCGKTLRDKMNNEKICELTGVVRLEEFLREKVVMVGTCEENG